MKINSISVLFSIPIILICIYTGFYLFYKSDSGYFIPFIIVMVILIAIYTLQPHIDYLWDKRNPKSLEERDRIFLRKFSPYYNSLSEIEKSKFENRVYVFTRAKDFKLIKREKINLPHDFKVAIATNAVLITMELKDFLFGNFDYFFCYEHGFPTPKIQTLHHLEINIEDKASILNIELLINSLNPQNRLINIGILGFAQIFEHLYRTKIIYTVLTEKALWSSITEITGFIKEDYYSIYGFLPESGFPILAEAFFTFRDKFKQILPVQYEEMLKIFNITAL